MGTGLVPIHLLAIIVQSQVVRERHVYTVRAPVTFNLFVPEIHPDLLSAGHMQHSLQLDPSTRGSAYIHSAV